MDIEMNRIQDLDIPKINKQYNPDKGNRDISSKYPTNRKISQEIPLEKVEKVDRFSENVRVSSSQPQVKNDLSDARFRTEPATQPLKYPQESPIHEVSKARKSKYPVPDAIRVNKPSDFNYRQAAVSAAAKTPQFAEAPSILKQNKPVDSSKDTQMKSNEIKKEAESPLPKISYGKKTNQEISKGQPQISSIMTKYSTIEGK